MNDITVTPNPAADAATTPTAAPHAPAERTLAEILAEPTPGTLPFDVEGVEVIQEQGIEAPNAREAVQRFRLMHPNAEVSTVGTRIVMGYDEGDGTPILDGDDYDEDSDGIMNLLGRRDNLGENERVFDNGPADDADDTDESDEQNNV